MKKTVKWTLFALSILLLLGIGAGLFTLGTQRSRVKEDPGERIVPVTAVTLARGELLIEGEYAARLKAVRDVTVTAQVGGTIVKDHITEGAAVRENDALYHIEDESYLFTMEQAEAAVDLADENYRKAQNISRPELIRRLEAVIAERESALNKAASDAARFEELFREGAVSLSRKEGADLALASAEAAMEIARENLQEAKAGARAEDQAAAEAALRQSRAAYKIARDRWEKTVVRTPLSGTVAVKKVFAGDSVRPGTPLAEVVDLTAFRIEIGVAADDIDFFKAGSTVHVLPPQGGDPIAAVVKDAGVKADERTGSFPVIIELESPDRQRGDRLFRAGIDVTVRFTRFRADEALVVPATALLRGIGHTWAYVVEGDIARRREVTVGEETEAEALITAGLEEGEVLVVVGQRRLREGDKVELSFDR